MLIGVIADTHDNLPATQRAVELLNSRNVEYMIHAGDITSPFTLRQFTELRCGYTGIFGNNDGDKLLLHKRSEGNIKEAPLQLTLDNRKVIVVHEHHLVDALAGSGHFDIVIFGHTHEPLVKMVGKTLVINPGEVCGWLYGKSTAAILDLKKMAAEITEL